MGNFNAYLFNFFCVLNKGCYFSKAFFKAQLLNVYCISVNMSVHMNKHNFKAHLKFKNCILLIYTFITLNSYNISFLLLRF